jgi:DNA polymerase-3 subunit gamma/tau
LGAVDSDALTGWAQAILGHDAAQALTWLAAQVERGRDPLQLLSGLVRHVRNLLVLRSLADAPSREGLAEQLVDEPADRLKRLSAQADGASAPELAVMLQILTGAYELIRRSPMAQTVLELVVIKLATREQWQSIGEISRRLEQLSSGSAAPASRAPARPAALPAAPEPTEPLPASQPETREDAGVPASEELLSQWAEVLARLGTRKMSLTAYLTDARPVTLEGNLLTVGLPAIALHQEVLGTAEHRRLIEQLLQDVFHRPIRIDYTTLPEPVEPLPDAKPAAAAPPIVQDIVNLFNATILDRPG